MTRIQHEKMLEQECDQWLALALPPRSKVCAFAKVGGRPKCSCGRVVGRLAGAAPPGWPDRLIIVWGYRDIYIELKRLGGKASPDQLAMHEELRELGKAVFVCDSLEAIRDALEAERIPLRLREV